MDNINIKLNNTPYKKNWWIWKKWMDYQWYRTLWNKRYWFFQKKYKFIAENTSWEIIWTLELMIEVNLAFIEWLLVSSKHRRKGIGKELIQIAENHAKNHNCTKIYLETNEGWEAEKFYKKIWYKITGIHEKHILNQKTLIFTKFL